MASILALPSSCGGEAGEVGAPAEDTEFRGGIAPPPASIAAEVAMLRAEPLELEPTTAVGAIPAAASVNAAGQAEYEIPLRLSPGVPGMTPELSIRYDSGSGNGSLGVGFDLSGASGVRRCTKTILDDGAWQPIRFVVSDALCLDGDRLVLANGVYGTDGSVYRLKHDPSRRVVLHGDIDHITSSFEVFDGSGIVDTYGTPPGTLWVGPNTELAIPYVWARVERRDRFDNTIEYVHSHPVMLPTGPGELRLDEIRYGGTGLPATERVVELDYDPHPDPLDAWFFGAHRREESLLAEVRVLAQNVLQHTYELDYGEGAHGESRLQTLTMCDREHVCLPPTSFTWGPDSEMDWGRDDVVDEYSTTLLNDLGTEEIQSLLLNSPHTLTLDLDGDLDHELMFRRGEEEFSGSTPWRVWNEDDEDVIGEIGAPMPPVGYDELDDEIALSLALATPDPMDVFAALLPRVQPALSASVFDYEGDRMGDAVFPTQAGEPFDAWGHAKANGFTVGRGHGIDDFEMFDVDDGSADHIYTLIPLDHDGDLGTDFWMCRGPGYKSGRWVLAHNTEAPPYGFAFHDSGVGCSVHDELSVLPLRGGGQRLLVVPAYETNIAQMPVPDDFEDPADYVSEYEPRPDNTRNSYELLNFDLTTGVGSLQGTGLPRDRFQRWHDARCRNGLAHEAMGAPVYGAGLGSDKLVDVNRDGFVDVLRFELATGDALEHQPEISEGLPTTWGEGDDWLAANQCDDAIDDPRDAGVRVWWNTGLSFLRGDFVVELDGNAHANYRLNFLGTQAFDADDDGSTDLFMPVEGENTRWTLFVNEGDGTFSAQDAAIPPGWPSYNDDATWEDELERSEGTRVLHMSREYDDRPRLAFIGAIEDEYDTEDQWHGVITVVKPGGASFVSNRVTEIHDGLGKWTTFAYDAVDVSDVEGPSGPRTTLSVPLFVTTNMCEQTRSDPADDPSPDHDGTLVCTLYSFGGAVVDRLGRGLLGFRESWASGGGRTTWTRYSQEYDTALSDYAAAGRPLEVLEAHWIHDPDSSPGTPAEFAHVERTNYTWTTSVSKLEGGSTRLTYAGTVRRRSYSANADECDQDCDEAIDDFHPYRDTTVTETRDAYGTVTLQTSVTDHGEETTWTATDIDHDLGLWLLGRVGRVDTLSCSFGGDCKTRTTEFAYDGVSGAVSQITTQPGNGLIELVTDIERESHGNVETTTQTPAFGPVRVTTIEWDAEGVHPLSQTNALDQVAYFVHDTGSGAVLAEVDVAGTTMRYGYDGFFRETSRVRHATPMGPDDGAPVTTRYLLPEAAEVGTAMRVRVLEAHGQRVTTHLDAVGRPVLRTWFGMDPIADDLPQGLIPAGGDVFQRYAYDILGFQRASSVPQWAVAAPQPSGDTIPWNRTEVDPMGRHARTTAADGTVLATTRYQYFPSEPGSTRATVTDGDGHASHVDFDAHGHPIVSEDAAGTSTCYVPGAFGATLQVRRNCGPEAGPKPVTNMEYDAYNNLRFEQDSGVSQRSLIWNAFGELVNVADGNGAETVYARDELGRVETRSDPSGPTTFTWDTVRPGRLSSSMTPGIVVSAYEYDTFGRVEAEHTSVPSLSGVDDYVFEYDWGPGDRLDELQYPAVDGEPAMSLQLRWDEAGHLRGLVNPSSGAAHWIARDANARTQVETEWFGNQMVTQRAWHDERGWLEMVTTGKEGSVAVQAVDYIWSTTTGELRERSDLTAAGGMQRETFALDELHRLRTATVRRGPTTVAKGATYDRAGNLLTKTDVGAYVYDGVGKLQTIAGAAVVHDGNGNVTSHGGRTFSHTPFDKVASVTQAGTTTTFTYDADHRKVLRSHPVEGDTVSIGDLYERAISPAGATQSITYRVYAGDSVVTQIVRTKVGLGGWATSAYRVHDDHLGSTNFVTNSAGNIHSSISHDAWGRARVGSNWTVFATDAQAAAVGIGFTGHRAKLDAGMIDMRGRTYDPRLGRFLQADPIVADPLQGDSWNRYSYVGNRPLMFTDPSGFTPDHGDDVEFEHDFDDEDGVRGRRISVGSTAEYEGCGVWAAVPFREFGFDTPGLGPDADVGGTSSSIREDADRRWNWAVNELRASHKRQQDDYEAYIWAKVRGSKFNPLKNLGAGGKLLDKGTRLLLEYGQHVHPGIALLKSGIDLGDALAAGDDEAAMSALAQMASARVPGLGIIYKRTNTQTGKEYIGQTKSPERFDARQKEHDRQQGAQHAYEVLGRADPGPALDVMEESLIRMLGGPKSDGGTLENKRHQMSDKRYDAAGGKVRR